MRFAGLVGAPACGDVMKLQIKVDPNTQTISDVKFKTFGCGSAIASSSYLTELVRGMTLEKAGKIRNTEIAKELCLPPVKLHCSMLAEDAIKSAIGDYYKKSTSIELIFSIDVIADNQFQTRRQDQQTWGLPQACRRLRSSR